MRSIVMAAAWVATFLAMAGCTDYLARRDGLGYGAGDAVNTNVVTHVIDPWPRHAGSTDPTTNGDRLARAVERYRTTQTSGQGASASSPTGGVAASGGVAGATGSR